MIYVTPYDTSTQQCTAQSTDSGFATLAEVVAVMGPPMREGPRMLLYPGGVAFTDYVLRAEP